MLYCFSNTSRYGSVLVWQFLYQKDIYKLDGVQRRATKMIKRPEGFTDEVHLNEPSIYRLATG